MTNEMSKRIEQEEMLTKELDTLENAIGDENHALAVCAREEIWKIVYRIVDLAVAEERRNIRNFLENSSVWESEYIYQRKALLLQKFDELSLINKTQ